MIYLYEKPYQLSREHLIKLEQAYDQLLSRREIGFKDLSHRVSMWEQCIHVSGQLSEKYQKLAVIGIGGSSLGAQTIVDAFQLQSKKDVVLFDNVDPSIVDSQLEKLGDLTKVCWLVVSKSGGTMETLALADYANQFYKKNKTSFVDKVFVITENKPSLLFDWAQENKIPFMEMPLDVGGRFSVLTPVGLIPAGFLGLNLSLMREGVQWALENKSLTIELAGQFIASVEEQRFISMIWSYVDQLKTFGFWWQQLWAESLAKAETRSGEPGPRVSTPIACRGPNDQHSLLQQVVEGYRDKFLCFITLDEHKNSSSKFSKSMFKNLNLMEGKGLDELMLAEAHGTLKAVRENGTPCLGLGLESLNEKVLGALFMVFQLKVGLLGEYLNIDAFNQPGVELSKKITKEILRQG